MKNLLFVFSLLLLVFASCELDVYFADANPPGIEALNVIPQSFIGSFECESDGSRIHTNKRLIVQEFSRIFETSVAKVRETEECTIVAGGLYLPGRKECIPFEYINEDSIRATIYTIDTLFSFSDTEIAKEYKGRLFLNVKNELSEWITFMVSPQSDGSLLWEVIDVPTNIKKLEDVSQSFTTRVNSHDETKYTITTTLANFEDIISNDYKRECDVLYPIELPFNF